MRRYTSGSAPDATSQWASQRVSDSGGAFCRCEHRLIKTTLLVWRMSCLQGVAEGANGNYLLGTCPVRHLYWLPLLLQGASGGDGGQARMS